MTRLTWVVYGKLLTEQHSIMTLSSTLKRDGVDVSLIYANTQKEIMKKLRELRPDIVAYSLMFGSHRRYIPVSREIRRAFPSLVQVAGGPYTTYFPQSIDELSLDAICIGDGDVTLSRYVKSRKENPAAHIDGFHIRGGGSIKKTPVGNLLDDLDTLPFPDREIFYDQDTLLKNQEFKSFLSGRGCPFLCNYCFNHKFNEMHKGKGNIIRKKPVDYFIEEISEVKGRYGLQYIIFEDDVLTIKKDWFYEFAGKFKKKIGVPYICYTRPNLVNREMMGLLKESGCHIVRMAIETGNEEVRTKVLNRAMTNDQIIRAADIIHDAGLKLSVSNMIGLPTETLENSYETLDLNIRCRAEHPSAQFFMPYPGMELTNIAVKTGYFDPARLSELEKNTWKTSPLKFDKETKARMEKLQKVFALVVRFPSMKRFLPVFFRVPSVILYYLSMFVKIYIVVGYLPPAKVSLAQRTRVLFRFFSFYG
ncbi:MAG: B12-binding domain-containing radical SAM protein [Deltaproteobacteria bacterium]|nr:B12-binding domain-containing radical SAM protein [Deltaproteobacteria bacterium]